jgi:hypothetical protein
MMFHKTIRLVSLALCCLFSTTVAAGELVPVAKQSGVDLCLKGIKIEGYRFKECQPEAGGTATFFTKKVLSQEPNEFDDLPMLVLVTTDKAVLLKRIGWDVQAKKYLNNPLVLMPYEYLIEERGVAKLNARYLMESWNMRTFWVRYRPGRAEDQENGGFILNCITALHETGKKYMAVSQCFDYSEVALKNFQTILKTVEAY